MERRDEGRKEGNIEEGRKLEEGRKEGRKERTAKEGRKGRKEQ
jgi:hypothetical protein